jgi:hypothetical protein
LVEKDPLPEPEPEGDIGAIPAKKGKKNKKKAKAVEEATKLISETLTPLDELVAFPDKPLLKEELVVEEKLLSELEAEVVEEFFAPTKKSKKVKKKKGKLLVEDRTLTPIEVPADSPITEGWVGAESNSF